MSAPSRVAAVGPYIQSSTMPRMPSRPELLVKPALPDGSLVMQPAEGPMKIQTLPNMRSGAASQSKGKSGLSPSPFTVSPPSLAHGIFQFWVFSKLFSYYLPMLKSQIPLFFASDFNLNQYSSTQDKIEVISEMTLQDVWCSPVSPALSTEVEAGGFCFGANLGLYSRTLSQKRK